MTSLSAPASTHFRQTRTLALIGLCVLLVLAVFGSADASAAKNKRIVALTPFSANAMGMLGVTPVGVGDVLTDNTRAAYVPLISNGLANGKIKQLPLSHPNGPNLEQLAKLRPKLVYTSPQWSKGSSAMRSLRITVKKSEPTTLGGVYSQMKSIARNVNKQKKANRLVRQMRAQVKKAIPVGAARSNKKVMVILGVGRTPFTFLGNSWGGSVAKMAGGSLQTGGATSGSGFARISDEVVIASQPEVIIAVPHASKGDIPELKEFMRNNPAWASTPAIENDDIFVSTDNSLLQAGVNPGQVIKRVRGWLDQAGN